MMERGASVMIIERSHSGGGASPSRLGASSYGLGVPTPRGGGSSSELGLPGKNIGGPGCGSGGSRRRNERPSSECQRGAVNARSLDGTAVQALRRTEPTGSRKAQQIAYPIASGFLGHAMKCAAPSCLLVLLLASGTAFAWDPLGIDPLAPTTNQLISTVMGTGGCDALPSTDGFPQISQTGQNIRVLFYGVRATDPEFCVYPDGQYAYPLGHYPAGNYSLRIDVVYEHFPFGLEIVTLATIPFSVWGAPAATPVAAPALNGTALALLAALIAAVAAIAFRRWITPVSTERASAAL